MFYNKFPDKTKLHFQNCLSSFKKLSKNDITTIVNAVQDYLIFNIKITFTDSIEKFSEACSLKNYTTYKIINNNFIVQKQQSSHLLVASEGVVVSISNCFHDFSGKFEDTLSISGEIHFSNDRVNFVLIFHETFGLVKEEHIYRLTIFAP